MPTDSPAPANAARGRLATLLGTDPGPPIGPVYAIRTASAAVIALLICRFLGISPLWAVVSATVVTQPEVRASVSATLLRVVANLVGVGVGALSASLAWSEPIFLLVIGLLVVAVLCRVLGIDAASRSAGVAFAIVLLKDPGNVVDSSKARVVGVLLGCAVALAVTGVVVAIEKRANRAPA
jgi:uncharacterized membrane protein YgaE (UPF0421/DUF939 family)